MREQRAAIYALNAAMAAHEQAAFVAFKARMEAGGAQALQAAGGALGGEEGSDSEADNAV